MTLPFHLSSIIPGHTQDVKALVALPDNCFASSSRDGKVHVWRISGKEAILTGSFELHRGFVNSLAYLNRSVEFPNGLLISGGQDKILYAYDPFMTSNPVYTLIGHTDNICALSVSKDDSIISGSWDKLNFNFTNYRTAKVWKNGQCVYTLTGHLAAIWGVLSPEPNLFITSR